jgi:hypothetical protein
MKYPILRSHKVSQAEFLRFWSREYDFADEEVYDAYIGKRLTEQRVLELFRWKHGRKLPQEQQASIRRHFINRLKDLRQFSGHLEPTTFFHHFSRGGPIRRIFFLHICRPNEFPMFDQHVFRAMRSLQSRAPTKLPRNEERVIQMYNQDYRRFHGSFSSTPRTVDKALWAFGRFLKSDYKFMKE